MPDPLRQRIGMVLPRKSIDEQLKKLHLCVKRSRWKEAIEILEKLIRLEPANVSYSLRIGDYYIKLGDKERAIVAYMEAGEKFSKGGFWSKAASAYKMILRLEPNHAQSRERLQVLHNKMKEQSPPIMIIETGVPLPSDSLPPPHEPDN